MTLKKLFKTSTISLVMTSTIAVVTTGIIATTTTTVLAEDITTNASTDINSSNKALDILSDYSDNSNLISNAISSDDKNTNSDNYLISDTSTATAVANTDNNDNKKTIYPTNGWYKNPKNKKVFYYKNSKLVKGWQTIKGKRYYFSSLDGAMRTGWGSWKGKKCYLNSNGTLKTSTFFKSGSKWYYFNSKGFATYGFINHKGKTYYLYKNGKLANGLKKISGKTYYFKSNKMVKNKTVTIKKYNYTFNKKGILTKKKPTGSAIASTALKYIGTPYVYGGTSPRGFDCSGFVQYVYKKNGLKLPRSSKTQRYVGKKVSYSSAKVGDILCFTGHVGIYLGNGRMVHAPYPGKRVSTLKVSYMNQSLVTVRRLV